MKRYIYFVKPVGQDGPIKIGCTRHLSARIAQLDGMSPVPLELIASAEGDFDLERHLHSMFASTHVRGEWFAPSAALTQIISDVVAGVPLPVPSGGAGRIRSLASVRGWETRRLSQQMTGQGRRRAKRADGVAAPVPSFAGSSSGLLPVRFRTGSFIPSLRHAARPVDATSQRQPKPSSSAAFDGQHHHRKATHGLGEVSQGLGNA